jgi:hypothetical protein
MGRQPRLTDHPGSCSLARRLPPRFLGYLTTVTVYNDGLDLLVKHPVDFCEKLYLAATRQECKDFGIGYFANFANVQRSRHADDHTTYVHMGNTVTEVNPYSPDFKQLVAKNPEFAEKLVRFMSDEVKELKRLLKGSKVNGQEVVES